MNKWLGATVLVMALLAPLWRAEQPSSGDSGQTTRFPSAKVHRDGDLWLGWDESGRKGYIRGYLQGYWKGHNEGCETAILLFVPAGKPFYGPDPSTRCAKAEYMYTRAKADYVQLITSFYQTYPKDREIPLPYMLMMLSDQKNMTPVQIHEWYVNLDNRNVPELHK